MSYDHKKKVQYIVLLICSSFYFILILVEESLTGVELQNKVYIWVYDYTSDMTQFSLSIDIILNNIVPARYLIFCILIVIISLVWAVCRCRVYEGDMGDRSPLGLSFTDL